MMKRKLTVLTAFTATALILGGCTTQPKTDSYIYVHVDPTVKTIKQAMLEIRDERRRLADIARANNPAPKKIVIPPIAEMKTPIYIIQWSGPVNEIMQNLAEIIGYKFYATGNPTIKPIVHIDSNGKPAADVLMEIADQGEGVYDIQINPAQKTLKIVYR